mmetsp:Transcript_76427/g.216084  ORF Transcript_76427/g.216084 Transcript_76427/m.216084 type:complete len:369 (+) Transcript_76427:98-1204(+)
MDDIPMDAIPTTVSANSSVRASFFGRNVPSDSQSVARVHGPMQRPFLRPNMALVRGRAVVNFNNQNTVLLKLIVSDEEFVLLHDNRMFRFSLREEHIRPFVHDDQAPKPCADELAQNILLRFQTSPKYRILNALFLSFRLVDNVMLLTVFVLTLMNGGHFRMVVFPSNAQISVYSVIGVELFYDVLLMTSKFWFLERLSPFVGVALYAMYFTVMALIRSPYYVWVVVLIRLAAFVIEESVDIAIDLEMHNDLLLVCDAWPHDPDELRYTDIRRSLLDFPHWPTRDFFQGSGSAWLPKSAFSLDSYKRERFPWLSFGWLYFIPAALFLPIALVLGFFVSIPMSLCLCLAYLRSGQGGVSDLWAEMRHTY